MAALIHGLTGDVRFGARMLRRNPVITLAAVLTLAVGIGLTTVVFTVVNAVLLRPLAGPGSERLVWVATKDDRSPFPMEIVLAPDFVDWKANARSFEAMVAFGISDEPIASAGLAARARTAVVSEDFWTVSGARVLHGRLPSGDDPLSLVVSHRFFEDHLAGDPGRIGQPVTVDGRPGAIVGVLAPDFLFHFPPSPFTTDTRQMDAYRVNRIEASVGPQIQLLNVIGRLRLGFTIEQARAELDVLHTAALQANPNRPGAGAQLRVVPLADEIVGGARRGLLVMLLAVAFVLLIACGNTASLLLGRAAGRRGEIAVRASIGATRARIARQLTVESLLLAACAAALAILFARWGVAAIVALSPYAVPRLTEAVVDGRVLLFTAAVTIASAGLFACGSLMPLWTASLTDALADSGRVATSARRPRAGLVLAAVQIALAFVLLTGAGLLIKSYWRLNAHPDGFEPEKVLALTIQFSGPRYQETPQQQAYAADFLRTVAALPGIRAASLSTRGDSITMLRIVGAPAPTSEEQKIRSSTLITSTSHRLPEVLGLRMVAGRWLLEREPAPVVVINEAAARRDFPGQDPIGRAVVVDDAGARMIVGVVGDAAYSELGVPVAPEAYVPYADAGLFRFVGLVRTDGPASGMAPMIRAAVTGIDRSQPVYDVASVEQLLAESIRPRRFNTVLLTVMGSTALLLSLVGIYGIVALGVAERVREIAIRIAVGAGRADVLSMILRQGAAAALAGVAVGTAAAIILTRWMESLLYEVSPLDPQVLGLAATSLVGAALLACWIPARAAARIDPIDALRR